MAKALQHVQNLKPKVDFIINGGDSIMDALAATKESTQTQWGLFHSILKNENSLPIYIVARLGLFVNARFWSFFCYTAPYI